MQQPLAAAGQRDGNHEGSGLNWYKHYMGDYNRDTAHLSLSEHGAYRVLLDTYYATAKPLPASPDALYRLAKAMNPAERKAVDLVALQFFPVGADGLRRNVRADREIAKHQNQAEINREIGKRGGRPIGSVKITESVIESVSESVSKSVSKMEPANNPNQKPDVNLKPNSKTLVLSDAFVSFWNSWPSGERKVAKGQCAAVWNRKKLDASATEILAHVTAMKFSDSWKGGYVPMPMTYLNEARWDGAEVTTNDWQKGVL